MNPLQQWIHSRPLPTQRVESYEQPVAYTHAKAMSRYGTDATQ